MHKYQKLGKSPGALGVAVEVDADLDAIRAQLARNVWHRPGTDIHEVLCLCLYPLPPLGAITRAQRIAMHLDMHTLNIGDRCHPRGMRSSWLTSNCLECSILSYPAPVVTVSLCSGQGSQSPVPGIHLVR